MAETTKKKPVQLLPPPTQIVAEHGGKINDIWYRFFNKVANAVQIVDDKLGTTLGGSGGDDGGGGGGGGTIDGGDLVSGSIPASALAPDIIQIASKSLITVATWTSASGYQTAITIDVTLDNLLKAFSVNGSVSVMAKKAATTKKTYVMMRLVYFPSEAPTVPIDISLPALAKILVNSTKSTGSLRRGVYAQARTPADVLTTIGAANPGKKGKLAIQVKADAKVTIMTTTCGISISMPRA